MMAANSAASQQLVIARNDNASSPLPATRKGRVEGGESTAHDFAISLNIVIASAARQSILPLLGEMDCFAEPVIGRAFARPVGSQ